MREEEEMTNTDQHLAGRTQPAASPPPTLARSPAVSGGTRDGGDPACWACLVCQECGAVISEGHRAGCSEASQPAGPLRTGA